MAVIHAGEYEGPAAQIPVSADLLRLLRSALRRECGSEAVAL